MRIEHPLATDASGTSAGRWIELWAPTPEEMVALGEELGLHELSLEDALRAGHPPKVEEFDDHLFAIAHTPIEDGDRLTLKLSLYLGAGWVVSVGRLDHPELRGLVEGVRGQAERRRWGPARVFHKLLDSMTDGFEVLADGVEDELEAIEQVISELDPPTFSSRTIDLRRRLMRLTHLVRGQHDMARGLRAADVDFLPESLDPYFRDVMDHLARLRGRLESSRDHLMALCDAFTSAADHRLSQVMRVLTVIATIMMPLSLLAGIYGMNVEPIPGAGTPASFWWIVAAMLVLAVAMLAVFRRKRWL